MINQDQAIGFASYAMLHPSYTHGHPARAARAIASEDWLAGQTMLYGDFGSYAPANQWDWTQLRNEVRAAIGVSPQASSQELVDRLLAIHKALRAGDKATINAQLSAPIFTLGPDRTLAALADLPDFRYAQQAFAELRENEEPAYGPAGSTFR